MHCRRRLAGINWSLEKKAASSWPHNLHCDNTSFAAPLTKGNVLSTTRLAQQVQDWRCLCFELHNTHSLDLSITHSLNHSAHSVTSCSIILLLSFTCGAFSLARVRLPVVDLLEAIFICRCIVQTDEATSDFLHQEISGAIN